MSLTNRIKEYGIALALSTTNLAGCATTTQTVSKPVSQFETARCPTYYDAMDFFKIKFASYIKSFGSTNGDCYKTTVSTEGHIRKVAGIYVGIAETRKVEGGCFTDAGFSQAYHPETFDRVLKDADTNGDHFITRKEIGKLENTVIGSVCFSKNGAD